MTALGLLIVSMVAGGLLTVLELILRRVWGFGNPLIYQSDPQCGYLLAPNQTVRRLGNRITINEYSMRSPPIAPLPSVGVLRVLLLGDSVANGSWWTDQADTISEKMAQQLSPGDRPTETPWTKVEVLNASANSWGPRNELAYVQRFGTFGARAVILLINTDDLFAKAPNGAIVGRDRNYPARKPPCALLDVAFRYLLPNSPIPEVAESTPTNQDWVRFNLEAIEQIYQIALETHSYFLLALTPLLRETNLHTIRNYEMTARSRLAEWVQTQQIAYLDFLPIFQSITQPATLYRDTIHLSPQGNALVSHTLSLALQQEFEGLRVEY